ncbi:MAG: hypothetical protein KKF30_17360 [Proteobacteria bacterium]|nr:hypothetical protein [Pseudomonadota bacterium]MBU4319026.1 hypothetical protein [Pseudomonadota bacterium]MBU4469148.1 hypothetical protein [Pseudomonadota bacterium]MCG2752180.1 hypothetical protein [Desulfobacteraceae bacterium]
MKTGSEKKIFFSANYRKITIKTVDGELILGKINLASKQRVSDLFTKDESSFIVMVDAVSKDVQGKTLFINKEHIIWVEPEDDGEVK